MPPELASQLAAGEVVERPASVVKELIENSLDAGASSIEIEVSLSRKRIRVKDDGSGIAPGELELALGRYGTSKISSIEEICGIRSYGFRGEALPAIASVSRLTLTSHRKGEKTGRRIVVEGGKVREITDAPALTGTEVLVENLFYNTPARRKFARSNSTEMMHVTSRVIQSALSSPAVRFSFIKDGKRVLDLPPARALLERVRSIFGEEYAQNLVEADYSDFNIKINGLVGRPTFNRATAMDQYFFVNSRPVKDGVVRAAVARAYEDLIPRGRRPVVFLNISLPPGAVDVNVHPAKAEVRFSSPGEMSSALLASIRRSLGNAAVPHGEAADAFSQPLAGFDRAASPGGYGTAGVENRAGFARTFELWSSPALSRESAAHIDFTAQPLQMQPSHGRLSAGAVPIGQLFRTFLVFEDGDRMVVMDQHTVHERILFERLMKRFRESSIERQSLLITDVFKLEAKSAGILSDHLKDFHDLGWSVEEFGDDRFVIREVPALLVGKDYRGIVNELISVIASSRDAEFAQMISDCAARMACRGAVMAGDALSLKEIAALAEEFAKVELPYSCPHGRPVAMTVSKEKLFKDFGRPPARQ
jgi:DNA mismatch repair protein MutL